MQTCDCLENGIYRVNIAVTDLPTMVEATICETANDDDNNNNNDDDDDRH